MKRTAFITLIFALFSSQSQPANPVPIGAQCLINAYPDKVCGFGANALIFCDDTQLVWDDGRAKTPQEAIDDADLEDQFRYRYTTGETPIPTYLADPGRVRSDSMFQKLYGSNAKTVEAEVKTVQWFDRKLKMTTRYQLAKRIEKIEVEVRTLPKSIQKKVRDPSGGFVWRKIKGTQRQSSHSYAIAVDVGVASSDYWKWNKKGKDGRYKYKSRFPLEVVEIFERHGFIWGGKWYHFDTMHFEFRPELICAGKLQ